ncbi:Cuticle protein 16.8 [Sarcoptes scabiei]|uniref:Cuticle protein 16.8 n=1 Tax=Sarcoptes scabiei TaxID=52283 RepID=A0A834RD15_SARSC|nr:Cuticle protein 16.8 [Sarcoptes scabiei]
MALFIESSFSHHLNRSKTTMKWRLTYLMLVIALLANISHSYMLIDDDELGNEESSPRVAIIYPRAIGPEIPDELEMKESTETSSTENPTEPPSQSSPVTVAPVMDLSDSSSPSPMDLDSSETEKTKSGEAIANSNPTTTTTATTESPDELQELPASASAPSSVFVPSPRIRSVSEEDQKAVAAAASSSQSSSPSQASSSQSSQKSNQESAPINRLWHFNTNGVHSQAAWSRVDRDSDAVESNPSPVFTASANQASVRNAAPAQSSPVFVRKPVFTEAEDLATGELPSASNQRNLYYPDINRLQSPGSSASASASAAASSSASASSSFNNGFQSIPSYGSSSSSFNNAQYGLKGGASKYIASNQQWQQQSIQSPVKAVRKVVKSSNSRSWGDNELNQSFQQQQQPQQQPYRVRVVVQPNAKTQQPSYFDRLQDSRSSASASSTSAASSSASSSAFTQGAQQKEYVHVDTKITSRAGTKSPPPPPPAIKSPPPPPPAVKSPPPPPAPIKSLPPPPPPPRPVPVRQTYATKTPPRAAIRAPVFEQETEQQHYEQHVEQPEPEPYSFNFNVNDDSGTNQFRREEGDRNGVVRGSYGYTDAWGLYRIVDYVADKNGFRATIRTNEPGLVERNPVTNEVDNPAHIQVAAEDTPAKVVELMRLKKPSNSFDVL